MVLASLRDRKEAIKLDKASMGSRYVEVFEARYSEMSWMLTKEDRPIDVAKIRGYEHFVSLTVRMSGVTCRHRSRPPITLSRCAECLSRPAAQRSRDSLKVGWGGQEAGGAVSQACS